MLTEASLSLETSGTEILANHAKMAKIWDIELVAAHNKDLEEWLRHSQRTTQAFAIANAECISKTDQFYCRAHRTYARIERFGA